MASIRPFSCELCTQTFTRNENLERHRRSSTKPPRLLIASELTVTQDTAMIAVDPLSASIARRVFRGGMSANVTRNDARAEKLGLQLREMGMERRRRRNQPLPFLPSALLSSQIRLAQIVTWPRQVVRVMTI